MADFVQKSETKTAQRKLAAKLPDLAALNALKTHVEIWADLSDFTKLVIDEAWSSWSSSNRMNLTLSRGTFRQSVRDGQGMKCPSLLKKIYYEAPCKNNQVE